MLSDTVLLAVYWISQVIASLLFKFGSTMPQRWLLCFLSANIINIASTWILMILYKQMNVNVAMGLALGISILLAQAAVAVVFRSALSVVQIIGIPVTCIGLVMLSAGGR